MERPISVQFIACLLIMVSCRAPDKTDTSPTIEQVILGKKSDFYAVDFSVYDKNVNHLPIGVFDSGTGGLTVLDAILKFDEHSNETREANPDGVPDFRFEKFIYLADQANMPYGNYHGENKTELLIEHIIKDTQFLLSDKYYPDPSDPYFRTDKEPAKIIVVACNTATAYGLDHIRTLIKKSGSSIPVIGVIEAGAKGALDVFRNGEDGSIGVLATVGTIASEGYEKALRKLIDDFGLKGRIDIFSQG